ncbi:hypothetical protein [Mangrovibrevibacter kandeliae]|uniref:hypothetical protein n=1 Tax=Mangrovibrevibacter kandeliae TaxID=2968473 RepID=UPI00211890D1|nr:hypothetical protein [Aurantimonas sp. CSK15Z-1]MCQ8783939.1 hypothetical protein [Aurantimonas sp. CSK15Z-1]
MAILAVLGLLYDVPDLALERVGAIFGAAALVLVLATAGAVILRRVERDALAPR